MANSNIIAFIAELGLLGEFATNEQIKSLSEKYFISDSELSLIFSDNSEKLATVLDARKNVYAILVPTEDDDESDDSDDSEEKAA